jgi:hypothetical protein
VGVLGRAALGDASRAPRSAGAVGSGVFGLLPPGFLDLPPPPINWRRVEGGAEIACSQVTDVERLLHNTFSLVGRNILRPLWVSLKKGGKFCMCASGSLQFPSLPLVFVSAAFVSG